MRDYELVLVFDPDLTSEKQKKLIDQIKKIIVDLKGTIKKENDWGKKDLAYPIRKKTQGVYFLWQIKLWPKTLPEIEKKLGLEESLLRYLLTRNEEPDKTKKKLKRLVKKKKGGEKK